MIQETKPRSQESNKICLKATPRSHDTASLINITHTRALRSNKLIYHPDKLPNNTTRYELRLSYYTEYHANGLGRCQSFHAALRVNSKRRDAPPD